MKVAAIVDARIGDTLLATPVLRAVKQHGPPGTHLTVFAHPARLALLQELPAIDSLLPFSGGQRLKQRLSGKQFDWALCFGESAAERQFAGHIARACASRPVSTEVLHAVTDRQRLLQPLGIATAGEQLDYRVTARERASARDWLALHGITPKSLCIGIAPLSFPTKPYRDWPGEHFVALLARLADQAALRDSRPGRPENGGSGPGAHDIRFIAFGDAATDAAVRQWGHAGVISAAGALPLRSSAALLEQMQLYIGVDTGLTHLAGALRVPMVALYHCRHRGRHLAPLGHPQLRVLEHPAADAACSTGSRMAEISVDQVFNAACELLGAA